MLRIPRVLLLVAIAAAACSFNPMKTGDASGPPPSDDALTSGADGDQPGASEGGVSPSSDGPADRPTDQPAAGGGDAADAPLGAEVGGAGVEAGGPDRAVGPDAPKSDTGTILKNNGETCGVGGECVSGLCVDGVCCNGACTGQCQACDTPNGKGVCLPVTGAPRGSRAPCTGAGTLCAGSCDGTLGATCSYPSTDKLCGVASCKDNNTAQPAATCDGKGACVTPGPISCAPYTCGPTTCVGGCSAANPCSGDNYCESGKCTPKLGAGSTCSNDGQCMKGHCADGVCCDRTCSGDCEACNLPGKVGTCTFQQGNVCRDAQGACDVDEVCSGTAGTCPTDTLRPSTFVCRPGQGYCIAEVRCTGASTACPTPPPPTSFSCPASCSNGTFTPAAMCTGAGTCGGQPQSCGNHICTLAGCKTPCTGNGDCLAGFNCNNGACVSCPAPPSYCSGGMSSGTVCASSDGTQLGTCTPNGACVSGSMSMCPAGKYCSGAYPSASCVSPTAVGYGYYENPPGSATRGPTTGMYGAPVTVGATLIVRTFGADVYLPSSSRATFALFRDASGSPGALVAKAETVAFYTTGHNEFAATGPTGGATPQVTPGTYWLMLAIETTTTMSIENNGVDGAAQKQFPFTVGGAVPNPAPAASSFVSMGMRNGLYFLATPP